MGFTGDIEGLGRLVENLGRLSAVPSQAAREASESIAELIQDEFDGQVDPYGRPWAEHQPATVEQWGPHPILDLTGEMRDSVDVHPMQGAGIAVTVDDPAGFHQGGTKYMVARPILPGEAFPDTWARAIADACDNAAERAMSDE